MVADLIPKRKGSAFLVYQGKLRRGEFRQQVAGKGETMELNVLNFPGDLPSKSCLAALLVVHDAIFCYRPVEGLSLDDCEPFERQGLLRVGVPVPLGEDRSRFERAVHDLSAHGRDFRGAYLSAMTAENDPAGSDPGWALVAALAGDRQVTGQALWQARILLRLQGILDGQEREVNRGLAQVAARQTALLGALRGEETVQTSPENVDRSVSHAPAREEQLVTAWARLFFADQSAERPRILATEREAAAAVLLAGCEKHCRCSAQPLFRLALPGLALGDPTVFFEQRNVFRWQAASRLAALRHDLLAVAAHGDETIADKVMVGLSENVTALQEEIAACFPGGEGPATDLVVHRLPGVPMVRLLAAFCPEVAEPAAETQVSGLLVVVEPHR